MMNMLTKCGIVTGLLGTLAVGATDAIAAKSQRVARNADSIPYNYTCRSSWFYPGYYCYQPDSYYNWSYDWNPSYYAYDSCTAAVWDGSQWIRRRAC
jgi:hypothetical protein